MGNIKLLMLIMAAFGLTNSKRMFRKCTFCRYFYTTGHSPYELLWILADEVSAYLSEDQRITLFLDEEDLSKAELVFEAFCEKTCSKNPSSVDSEVMAEVAGTDSRSASHRAFNEPYDSETSPENDSERPSRRTLFKGVKIPPHSERASSAGKTAGAAVGGATSFDTYVKKLSGGFSEEVSAGMPAESSGTIREENNSDGLERLGRKEFRKHSGEYEMSGTLLSSGNAEVHSNPAETGNDSASDEVDAAKSETVCDPPCV